MRYRFLRALVAAAVAVAALPGPVLADEARTSILQSYHRLDAAFGRTDLDGVTAMLAPDWVGIDPTGKRMSRADSRAALAQSWKHPPNEKRVVFSNVTDVNSIEVHGARATARGRGDAEVLMVDTMDTVGEGHTRFTFEDQWVRTPAGWRCIRSRTLSSRQSVAAHASPAALAQLQNMRDMNAMMRNFNNNINYSNCFYSDNMQHFDYYERQQRCANP